QGTLAAILLTACAWFVHTLPFPPFTIDHASLPHPLGVSMLAILLGILVGNLLPSRKFTDGCKWITVWCIPAAVVFLGAKMDLTALSGIGFKMMAAVIGLMALAAGVSYLVGRALGMTGKAACLLGIGTAVCGSSAILAVAPVNKAEDKDVIISIGVVNLVGLLAMFACCAALWFMPLAADVYGAWAGASIHAIPQVIAAGENHSPDAAAMATLVKLARVALLAPVVLLVALSIANRANSTPPPISAETNRKNLLSYVPWFVWGFILFAILHALGWLPLLEFQNESAVQRISLADALATASKWLLAISMAAIGLQVKLKPMLKSGAKAMTAGIIAWLVMSAAALVVFQWIF
ncbi:MAG: YeiH family protein, partial [Akkermansiaceae bacterium]